MIVSYREEGWYVVTQRAHGILAAQLGAQWGVKDRPARWVETLLAIAEHDDAEVELDGESLLTPTGGPLNFDMKAFDLQHCEKLSMLTQVKNRYIALLTSLHMEFLYRREAASDQKCGLFLDEQAVLRKNWQKALHISEREAQRIYALLEWCDACSLLICQYRLQPEKRKLEISTGPDKKVYHLIQIAEATLTIEPWPFESEHFDISFEYRILNQLQFSSSAEFRKIFLEAQIEEQQWTIVKKKPATLTRKV